MLDNHAYRIKEPADVDATKSTLLSNVRIAGEPLVMHALNSSAKCRFILPAMIPAQFVCAEK